MTSSMLWFAHSNHCLHYCLHGCYAWCVTSSSVTSSMLWSRQILPTLLLAASSICVTVSNNGVSMLQSAGTTWYDEDRWSLVPERTTVGIQVCNLRRCNYRCVTPAAHSSTANRLASRILLLYDSLSFALLNGFYSATICEAYTHGIAVDVCLSVRLSNACIVTKRKHLAKKVQLWLIGSRPRAFQWA